MPRYSTRTVISIRTNLRRAKATSTYILRGDAEERFEPTMTFYGFRYIKVDGVDGDLNPDDFTAEVVYSGFGKSGEFASSMDIINRLQSNIEWGIPRQFRGRADRLPARDERLGWTATHRYSSVLRRSSAMSIRFSANGYPICLPDPVFRRSRA